MTKPTLATIQEAQQFLLQNVPPDTAAVLHEAQRLAALAWLTDAFYFYRKLGFFAATPQLSDTNLVQRYVGSAESDVARSPRLAPEILSAQDQEVFFLMGDTARVWASDLENDVCAANRSYTVFLHELAAVSRGLFAPENIVEEWSDVATQTHDYGGIEVQEGRIHLYFTCNEQPFCCEPVCCGDWLDVNSPLKNINQALQPTGFRFEQLEFDGLTGIVLLSASEKKLITRERGLAISRVSDAINAARHNAFDENFDPFEDE